MSSRTPCARARRSKTSELGDALARLTSLATSMAAHAVAHQRARAHCLDLPAKSPPCAPSRRERGVREKVLLRGAHARRPLSVNYFGVEC
jgi:hypothetical protein